MELNNVGFLRTNILNIKNLFAKDEVSEIWITFPDPQLKEHQERFRLTNSKFIELYDSILCKKGSINLKTDSSELFDYTLSKAHELECSIIHATKMLYISPLYKDELCIQTTYEKKFNDLGYDINYLKFRMN